MVKPPRFSASTSTKPLPNRTAGVTPQPQGTLNISLTTLAAGTVLHRIHDQQYNAVQFNPSIGGNARFSPIQNSKGVPIPTLYAGITQNCALMETAFHDVPYVPGFKTVDKNKLIELVHSIVETTSDLTLVDLASVPLRKLGITRNELIDTEKDQYPVTRLWAKEIYSQCPAAQGLVWISRQDDSTKAIVLFGDRVNTGVLQQSGDSLSITEDSATYTAVLELADQLGVQIVLGK